MVKPEEFMERGAAVRGLVKAFLSGAPVHATLIVGQPGVGKRTLSALCAQALFCAGAEKPCGACPGCRRFLSGSHPDAHRVGPKKSVGVEEIRGMTTALRAAAYEGGYRAVLIEEAGAMTPQAQNSLLKTLEEPPPQTVFLLTAGSLSELLPTVQSRCQVVRMPPLSEAAVADILRGRGLEPGRALSLAALSGGSPGVALSLSEDEAFWALRARVLEAMASARGETDIWPVVNQFKEDRGQALRVCDILELTFSGALRAQGAGETPPEDAFQRQLSAMDPGVLAAHLGRVMDMRRRLSANVAWQAVLERFLLEYVEENRRWQS